MLFQTAAQQGTIVDMQQQRAELDSRVIDTDIRTAFAAKYKSSQTREEKDSA